MFKFRDILKKTKFNSKFMSICEDAPTWLRALGKNDFHHSSSIEMLLDRLVPSSIKKNEDIFDHAEIFILLASVYLHDIGRKVSSNKHEIYSYDEIIKNPEKYHLSNKYVAEAVAQVCIAHSLEKEWPIEKCDKNYGIAGMSSTGRPLNLQKLAALLRLSDELDNSFFRVDEIPNQKNSPRQIIRDVNPIHKKGIIEIQATPDTWKQWSQLQSIRNDCQERLNEIQKYLEEIGLNYYQIWLEPGEFYLPLSQQNSLPIYYDLIQLVALVAENHYSSVDIYETIDESEISVLCTDKRLGVMNKIAILVRDYLSEEEAYECKGVLTHLKNENKIDNGIIVIKEKPNNSVVTILSNCNINLITIDALTNELYEFSKPLNVYIEKYESLSLYIKDVYISLSATLEDGKIIPNIENHINEWIDSNSGVQMTLLGDFGAGKTTITEHIAYTLAKKYVNGNNNSRIPIHIKLKNFGATSSIESIITDYFVNNLGVELSYKAFSALNHAGKFLIVLDGFDEIQNISNEHFVLSAFRQLDKLVTANSKVIMTCRTHFFKNISEIHTLHTSSSVLYNSIDKKYGYKFIFLSNLKEEQIEEYLSKWDKEKSANYSNIIKSIYNLSDLATRPVLLNIIAKTIPQLDIMNLTKINAASLYNIYMKFWLQRDDWRSLLNIKERLSLAYSIGEYMFIFNLKSIHYTLISDLNFIHKNNKYNPNIYDHELRTCNFLSRDHDGNYSFVHKSFMEFLLAEQFFTQLLSSDNIKFKWKLPMETSNGNSLIVSKETEDFFLQLMETWIQEEHSDILKICTYGKRNQILLINIFEKLDYQDYSCFYVELLLNEDSYIPFDKLASLVLLNNNWESDFTRIKEKIMQGYSLKHLSNILSMLLLNSSISQKATLKELSILLTDTIIDKSSENKNPFSKVNAKRKLAIAIEGLIDENEIVKAKRTWTKNWIKDKSEYEQKQKIKEQKENEDYEEQFDISLKVSNRRKNKTNK